jgi:hypothetical protein
MGARVHNAEISKAHLSIPAARSAAGISFIFRDVFCIYTYGYIILF